MGNEMVGLTPSQFQQFLLGWWKSGNYTDVVYVEGHHGIGKTDSVLQVAIEHFGTEEQKKMDPQKVLDMTNEERGWVFFPMAVLLVAVVLVAVVLRVVVFFGAAVLRAAVFFAAGFVSVAAVSGVVDRGAADSSVA